LQPLNFLIPIIELYQIERGNTYQWCFEGFRALGWDALSVLIHQSIIIPSHQQNVTQLMQLASPFSLSTTGIFPSQAQAISPVVCRWGPRTRPGCTACISDDMDPSRRTPWFANDI
jgi:hypothetical protein